jgi:hypothetical protein
VLWPLRRIVLLRLRRGVELLWSWASSLPLLRGLTASFHGITPERWRLHMQVNATCSLSCLSLVHNLSPLSSVTVLAPFEYYRTRPFQVSPYSPSLN